MDERPAAPPLPVLPLEPFPVVAPTRLPACRVKASCSRSGDSLAIAFSLRGDLEELEIPAPAEVPRRSTGLWETTCCEFFLAPAGRPGYWEFNLSPAGQWNVFRFSGYRQGMQEEQAFAALPFTVARSAEELRLDLTLDLAALSRKPEIPWKLALATVLLSRDGTTTFWALSHPAREADFHQPGGFLIEL